MATPRRVGVIGSARSWYVRDLARAAQELTGIEIHSISFDSLRVDSKAELHVFGKVQPLCSDATKHDSDALMSLSDLDALLVRTMPLGSLEQVIFRMNALHIAEQIGVPVLNAPRSLEICIDKWLTLQKARQAGLRTPHTICCQTRDDALAAWDQLGRDCVVKPVFGGEGRGILRVLDEDSAWRVFSTLEQLRAVMYVQEFIENNGTDLRLLVIGESLYCIRRSSTGNWRSNVSLGATVESLQPSFEQADYAYRAARAVGGRIVGVDLLESTDGTTYLIEVNGVPGWRGTSKGVGVDIAKEVLLEATGR